MEYRQLGRSGLRVSTLAMGTMTFGGNGLYSNVGTTGVDEAREQIAAGIDAGVNLIDTANIYSRGVAEEVTGHALKGRRDDVLLATKVRLPMGDGPNDAGLSRYHIIRSLEASLRRLQTDHVDLYQVHQWDGQTPPEETAAALDSLVSSGKVRYLGASNLAGWQLMKALAAGRHSCLGGSARGTALNTGVAATINRSSHFDVHRSLHGGAAAAAAPRRTCSATEPPRPCPTRVE